MISTFDGCNERGLSTVRIIVLTDLSPEKFVASAETVVTGATGSSYSCSNIGQRLCFGDAACLAGTCGYLSSDSSAQYPDQFSAADVVHDVQSLQNELQATFPAAAVSGSFSSGT